LRLRHHKHGHDEVIRQAAEAGLARARASDDPGASAAADVFEEALGVLRRSQAILEGVADGVYVTGPTGEILLWNRSAERLTACGESRALGSACGDILRLRVGGRALDCSQGCSILKMANGAGEIEIEAEREHAKGRVQNMLVAVSAVTSGGGQVAEIVHSIRDITTLKLADEAKTMFLATASHELKTPLTVILGFSQILLDEDLGDTDRRTALQAIEKRSQELSRIVDRLLMTGRIEAGRISLNRGVVDLQPIIADRTTALAAARERRIVLNLPDGSPPIIGDPDAITTVLDHLLDNAVKYSPEGEDVVVAIRKHASKIELEVLDLGIGMSPDEAGRCFDRFWQAESSDMRRFGGTGVGLYIVRSLVEGMGGSIDVRSMPGQGSTFTVRFQPATEQDLANDAASSAEESVGQPTMGSELMRQIGVPGGWR
jgi:PAS domain S-box-containing protein